ncbi:hypothetical protein B0A55_10707 [Friedmanniomyces simplex]|uniref:Uncharacterized protein n=1 Tax=Friedmanniomyces simplex TaxID=329884 RepID=A0A4U0WL68_9PEZI|nr:hypothetical protein B0A55_10707 [Friedmanniomyces simplex]
MTMDTLTPSLPYLVGAVLLYLLVTSKKRVRLPECTPWAGVKPGPFSRQRAHLGELFRGKEILAEGFRKYGKVGKAFAAPNFNFNPDVIVPPEYAQWIEGAER